MATAFAHALVGAGIGFAAPTRVRRTRLLCLCAALAVLPDLDVVAFWVDIPYAHPLGHRGLTHAPLFAFAVGVLAAPLVEGQRRDRLTVAGVLGLAMASHGLLDAFTDAGLGVGFLLPFDDARIFAPWRPLATSPIGVDAFFNGGALRILWNELIWIGLPLAAAVACLGAARR